MPQSDRSTSGRPARGRVALWVPFGKPNQKGEITMTIRDLIPWNRGRDVAVQRGENANPLLPLHREMNRVFQEVLRGFDVTPFGPDRLFDRTLGWPNIEVSETDKEVKVTAELPGLEEKDVGVELAHGVLVI